MIKISNNVYKMSFLYLIIILIQIFVIIFYTDKWKEYHTYIPVINIEDKKEKEEIEKFIKDKLEKIKSKFEKMNYRDFYNYLLEEKNRIFDYKDMKLYIFMWEKLEVTNDNTEFVSRIHVKEEDIGVNFSDLVAKNIYQVPFTEFKPEVITGSILYYMNDHPNDFNGYKYYWYDPIYKELVQKIGYSLILKSDEFHGYVGIGFNVKSISKEYTDIYYHNIYIDRLISISIFMFIGSILVLNILEKNNFLKVAVLFLLVPNIYILYYLNITEDISSLSQEEIRLNNINEGIMSISFLVSVNIFILTTLTNKKIYNNQIFLESSVIFSLALLLLLFSLYKRTDLNNINDMKNNRITKQLTFNLVIYYNLFIIINYLLFVSKNRI